MEGILRRALCESDNHSSMYLKTKINTILKISPLFYGMVRSWIQTSTFYNKINYCCYFIFSLTFYVMGPVLIRKEKHYLYDIIRVTFYRLQSIRMWALYHPVSKGQVIPSDRLSTRRAVSATKKFSEQRYKSHHHLHEQPNCFL